MESLVMRFGFQQPSHTFKAGVGESIFEKLKEIAQECEDENYDSFWIMDHLLQIGLVGKLDEPIMEAYTTLSSLAPVTTKIKLGVLCTCGFFRNPALLAKMGATLDQISKGRFWLGLGAGWYEEEARRYGYRFESNRIRLKMLEEALQIIRMAWTENNPTFRGKYYSISEFILSPKPVQKPRPPILVGGSGEMVTLKLVAKYADACNLFTSGEELKHKLEVLKIHCERTGNDYNKILKTKLSSVMFGKDRDDALRKIEPFRPRSVSPGDYTKNLLLGNLEDVVKQIEDLQNIGIEYLIVNFRGPYDPINKLTFSKEIMSRFS